jgi:hypothetical protein
MKTSLVLLVLSLGCIAWSFENTGHDETLLTIGEKAVMRDTLHHTISFISGMNIDADGSPRAYHPVSANGLDNLANAGKPGNWWGIVTVAGEPVIQDSTQPAPGYYVSATSLSDRSKSLTDPARYVDSETIPYCVIPNNKTLLAILHPGDIGYVRNLRNNRFSFAIFADVGPPDKIGEGSMRLAEKLGIPNDPRNGGAPDSVQYILFPGSGNSSPMTEHEIDSAGALYFTEELVNEYH